MSPPIISIPPSKSLTHRALVCAALAKGESRIVNPLVCDDTLTTVRALEQMGIEILRCFDKLSTQDDTPEEKWIVHGGVWKPPANPIDCRESATTWRLLTAITDTLKIPCTFTGTERLLERGQRPSFQESSQYLSGLLLAAPLGRETFEINLDNRPVSKPYVDMTVAVQKKFGIHVIASVAKQSRCFSGLLRPNGLAMTYRVSPQTYQSCNYTVEGDWSSAAFLIAIGLLHKKIVLENLNRDSVQGDKTILTIVKEMGGQYEWEEDRLVVHPSQLHGVRWNFKDTPDLYPIVSVLAHMAKGESYFEGTDRLRAKESDRLAEIEKLLQAQNGSMIDSKDHRIIMAGAILALAKGFNFQYKHPEAVAKSWPEFWSTLPGAKSPKGIRGGLGWGSS